jgi:hypothetical protein
MVLLACLDLAMAVAWLSNETSGGDTRAGDWLALGWFALVSISALGGSDITMQGLLLALLPAPLFFGIRRGLVSGEALARAIWLGSVCEAAIVVLQYCGLDPMRWFGWQPEAFASPRMRAYGTLGNPDFVAAWCCATLPFSWIEIARRGQSGRSRALRWAASVLQAAAVLATGSRVAALIIPLEAAVLALCFKRMRHAWLLSLPIAGALLCLAPARPLMTTIQGRLYLARVTAGHWQTPLTGYGPGAFEGRFAIWQAQWLDAHPRQPDAARFAGAVDHAHNDYLEFLVDYGPVGLGVFLGLAGWVLARAWRGRAAPGLTVRTSSAIGVASLLAIAAVDFPFHRPAEWSLFWLLSGILAASRNTNTQGA